MEMENERAETFSFLAVLNVIFLSRKIIQDNSQRPRLLSNARQRRHRMILDVCTYIYVYVHMCLRVRAAFQRENFIGHYSPQLPAILLSVVISEKAENL